MRISFKNRFIFLFSLVFLAFCALAAISWQITSEAQQSLQELAQTRQAFSSTARKIKTLMLQHRRYEKDFFLNIGDAKKQEKYVNNFNKASVEFTQTLAEQGKLTEKIPGIPAEINAATNNLNKLYQSYKAGVLAVFSQTVQKKLTPQQANKAMSPYKEKIHQLESDIDRISSFSSNDQSDFLNARLKSLSEAVNIALIISGTLLIAVSVTFFFISRQVLQAIREVIDFSLKLSKGDLNSAINMGKKINCSKLRNCKLSSCQSHGKESHCWVESGSFSNNPSCPQAKTGKDCRDCREYKLAVKTEVEEMGSGLNALAQELDIKSQAARQIAIKDLTPEINIASDKDTLGKSLDMMVNGLNDIFRQFSTTINQVNGSAEQLAQASQEIAAGSIRQTSAINEVSESINQFKEQIMRNTSMTARNSEISQRLSGKTNEGSKHMQDLLAAMDGITRTSRQVNEIIKVIDDIAFQTNLLALNAAVEAARAGSHGKGFAVVAQEVRSLASRSAKAAQQTGEIIAQSFKQVNNGATIARQTSGILEEISEGINTSTEMIMEMDASSHQQAQDIENIRKALEQIEAVTQQNSASTEEVASAAEHLLHNAEEISQQVNSFQLKESTFTEFVGNDRGDYNLKIPMENLYDEEQRPDLITMN